MAMVSQFRLAAPADAPAIARMSRDYIEQGLPWSWTPARVLRAISDRSSNVVLAASRSDVIGFGIMQYGEHSAHLALLAVEPACRQQGWGGRLLRWLLEPALALDLRCVQVEARADNPRAIAFYERRGFARRVTLPGYYRGAIDAMRLERPLRPGHADPMSAPLQIEREDDLGVYRLEGQMDLEQLMGQGAAAIALARAQQLRRLLILATGLALRSPPTTRDCYRLGERWAESAGSAIRVAIVTPAELIDPQHFRADVFTAEPAARAWLAQRSIAP